MGRTGPHWHPRIIEMHTTNKAEYIHIKEATLIFCVRAHHDFSSLKYMDMLIYCKLLTLEFWHESLLTWLDIKLWFSVIFKVDKNIVIAFSQFQTFMPSKMKYDFFLDKNINLAFNSLKWKATSPTPGLVWDVVLFNLDISERYFKSTPIFPW